MFHHDKSGKASFRHGGGAIHPKPGPRPVGSQRHGEAGVTPKQHAHGGSSAGEPHVAETHPGETQPHPETGVHAFHTPHAGGGQYRSHTHHGDGHPKGMHVETREHDSHEDMMAAHHEAFPPQDEADHEQEGPADATEYSEELAEGIGGAGGSAS